MVSAHSRPFTNRAALHRRGFLVMLGLLATGGPGIAAPQRIAAMNWGPAAALLALGIAPVAVPDIAGYRTMMAEPAMPAGVVDLGSTWEPNIELLQRIAPDLILTGSWQESFRPLYERIAPTIALATKLGGQDLAADRLALAGLGERLSRTAEARAWLDRVDRALEAAAAMPFARDGPVYLVSLHADARHVSVFGRGHIVQDVMDRLGIENAWTRARNFWGVDVIGVERLAERPEATILHVEDGARAGRTLTLLGKSAFWNALPAVREGRLRPIPEFYPYGGLAMAVQVAGYLAAALGGKEGGDV